MTDNTELSTAHIRAIIEHALAPHQPRGKLRPHVDCVPDGDAVTARLELVDDVRPAELALFGYGYVVEAPTSRGTGPHVRVTGWSLSGVRNRGNRLIRTIAYLRGSFEATTAAALDTYDRLQAEGHTPQQARKLAPDHATKSLGEMATRATGPFVLIRQDPADKEIADAVAVNDRLMANVMYLLDRHRHVAEHAVEWYAECGQDLPYAEAHDRARTAMRPYIDEVREKFDRSTQGDSFGDAYLWVHEHEADLALGFASWYCEQARGLPYGEAFRRWTSSGFLDSGGVDVLTHRRAGHTATNAARLAATDQSSDAAPAPAPDPASGPAPSPPSPSGRARGGRS